MFSVQTQASNALSILIKLTETFTVLCYSSLL